VLPLVCMLQVTFLEGASGLLAAQALLAHMQGEHSTKDAKIRVGCACELTCVDWCVCQQLCWSAACCANRRMRLVASTQRSI
jgi:hypothetical protein